MVSADGGARLFAEQDGRRVAMQGTLDELLQDPGSWNRVQSEARARFDAGEGDPVPQDEVLLPPVLRPGKIVGVGLNYRDHCREFGVDPPTSLVLFPKLTSSLCGHGAEVRLDPEVTPEVDWEAELAVVIGRRIRRASAEEARAAILGYTIGNDLTARDIQREEQQWLRAKGLDTFCPLGPVIVTAEEIPNPQDLRIRSRINGQLMQDSTTAEMIFGVVDLVRILSQSFTLEPGDVILTGTPLGVGAFRDPPVFLSPGDVMEMEIEGIGLLRNRCVLDPANDMEEGS